MGDVGGAQVAGAQTCAVTSPLASHGRSLSHYHHFLLGFLVPLLNARVIDRNVRGASRLRIPRCEPFEGLVCEATGSEIVSTDQLEQGDESSQETVVLLPHDYPLIYSRAAFRNARDEVARLQPTQLEVRGLQEEWAPGERRVLLIGRGREPAHEFPGSSSGANRRSVANQDAIYVALRREYPGCRHLTLEGLTLARQFALFSLADVIIGQHGAALANLIWANPEGTVIEIFPNNLPREDPRIQNFFGNLADCLGIRYRRVCQAAPHAPVDLNAIREEVRSAVAHNSFAVERELRYWRFRSRMFRWKAAAKLRGLRRRRGETAR